MDLEARLRTIAETLPEGAGIILSATALQGLLGPSTDRGAGDPHDMTVKEVAEHLHRSPQTIRRMMVAAFNGGFDLVALTYKESIVNFLGATYEENPDLWVQASPITYVGAQSAPFLFLHGDHDATTPYQQSVDMMNALEAVGVYAELFTAQGAEHGFFNNPPWYQPTLEAMEEFFTRILK